MATSYPCDSTLSCGCRLSLATKTQYAMRATCEKHRGYDCPSTIARLRAVNQELERLK